MKIAFRTTLTVLIIGTFLLVTYRVHARKPLSALMILLLIGAIYLSYRLLCRIMVRLDAFGISFGVGFLILLIYSGKIKILKAFGIVALVFLLLIGGAYFAYKLLRRSKWWKQKEDESNRMFEEGEKRDKWIEALSMEEAKRRALDLLANPRAYNCVEVGTPDGTLPWDLTPELKQFFSRYETVSEVGADIEVSRKNFGPSECRPGFLRIGYAFEGGEVELGVLPDDEAIYLVEPPPSKEHLGFKIDVPDHPIESYPSIYHALLILSVVYEPASEEAGTGSQQND